MQTINFRHLLRLFGLQISVAVLAGLLPLKSHAQFFSNDIDNAKYYFGITLGYNQSNFQLEQSPYFLSQDSVMVVEPLFKSGFNFGLRGTLHLTNHFDLRFNPALIFSERNISYGIDTTKVEKDIESVLLSLPLHIVLNSDRIGDFRVYAFGGFKFDNDLNSNAAVRKAEDMIKVAKFDLGYEAGIGFHLYFPAFVLSPELKISNGFQNMLVKNPGLIYSDVVEKLRSHMVIFSLNFE